MQKQTRNLIKFHLPVSVFDVQSFGRLLWAADLAPWVSSVCTQHSSAWPYATLVSVSAQLREPREDRAIASALLLRNDFYFIKILPSEFPPGKNGFTKSRREKMSNFLSSSTSALDEERGVYWSRLQELRTSKRRWCLKFSLPGNFIFKAPRHNAMFQERKSPKGYQSPVCEWFSWRCHILVSP